MRYAEKFERYCYATIRTAERIREGIAPRFDCARCGPGVNKEFEEAERGRCPLCPLTRYQQQKFTGWDIGPGRFRSGYRGLYGDWLELFEEDGDAAMLDEPALSRTLGAVLNSTAGLEDAIDPTWSLEFGELVGIYRSTLSRIRREQDWNHRLEVKHPPT